MYEYWLPQQDTISQAESQCLQLHQLACEFRQEQAYRAALEAYCQRYYQLARHHQQEYAAMQNDPNLLAYFRKKRDRT